MITYLVTASVTIEIDSQDPLTDAQIEEEAKRRFFAEIETYKQDEVRVEVFEEMNDE